MKPRLYVISSAELNPKQDAFRGVDNYINKFSVEFNNLSLEQKQKRVSYLEKKIEHSGKARCIDTLDFVIMCNEIKDKLKELR